MRFTKTKFCKILFKKYETIQLDDWTALRRSRVRRVERFTHSTNKGLQCSAYSFYHVFHNISKHTSFRTSSFAVKKRELLVPLRIEQHERRRLSGDSPVLRPPMWAHYATCYQLFLTVVYHQNLFGDSALRSFNAEHVQIPIGVSNKRTLSRIYTIAEEKWA